jgi:chorismate dehydratase
MLKIGWIDYINMYPFNFEFIGKKPSFKYTLIKGVPSKINSLIKNKKVDTGCISSAEYLENKDSYVLLDNLSISASNKVFSVAVFSNTPIEKVNEV